MFLHNYLNLRNLVPIFSLLFYILVLSFSKTANAQNVIWANAVTSNYNSLSVKNMCTNSANEVFTVGTFSDTVDFDPGPGIDMLNAGLITGIPTSVASFISKTSNAGSHIWTKAFVPYPYIYNSSCIVNDVTLDNNGNLYVVGRYEYTVDFDPGPGVDSLNSNGTKGVFVVKLDSAGNYLWGKTLLHNYIYLYSVKTDQNNNVILSGNFESTVDFDPGPSVYNMTASGINQLFVIQLDNAGNFVWSKTWAGTRGNVSSISRDNVEVDNANNVFICSRVFQSPIDLDPGLSVLNGTGTSMIVKLDQMGNYVWGNADSANTVFIKQSKYGDVYLTGRANVLSNPVYISKFNSQGVKLWTKYLGDSISLGTYFTGSPTTISEDTNGAILIGGIYLNNYFLYKVDSAGNYLWSKKSNSTPNLDDLTATYDLNNELIISADMRHVFDVDFGAAIDIVGQSGQYGSFLMKYNYCGANYTFNFVGCDSVVTADSTYFFSANYIAEYLDVSNCDSNVTIHVALNILNDVVLFGCDSVVYNGQTYTQNGIYTQIVTPSAPGCDSVLNITVKINTPTNQPSFLNLVQTIQPIVTPSPPLAYVLASNIEVDSLYNIYISGEFNHSCNFNPLGTAYIDSSFYPMYNFPDGFITRYDSSGILTWMHKFQTNNPNGPEAVKSLSLNDDLNLNAVAIPYAETVYQYNFNNNYYGTTQIGNFFMPGFYGYVRIQKVLNDPTSNQIVKIGSIDSAVNTTKQLYVKRGSNVAIFAAGGNYIGYEGAIDLQGNIYVASNMQVLNGGPTYCTLAKLDSNLNLIWNKQIGKGDEFGFTPQGMRVNNMQIDANGNLLICGYFPDSIDIDLSPNIHFLNSKGGYDAFIACIDTSANLVWAHSYGGTNSDDHASTITTDLNGNIYVGGGFSSSIDLDPSAGVSYFMKGCANADWKGGYISKFKSDGTFVKAFGTGTSINEIEFKAPNRIYAVGNPFLQVFELEQDTIVNNTMAICAGDSITVGNSVYTQSGTYVDTFALFIGVDSIVITNLVVNPLPNVIANTTDTTICSGDSVILFGSGALTFVWNNVVIDSIQFSPNFTSNYLVTGTDINGCINTDSIIVTVNALPNVVANASDSSVCIGNPVVLFGTGADSFTWTNNVLDSVAFYPIDTAMYVVTGIDINGCINQDSISVFVNQIPIPVLVFSGDTIYCTNVSNVNMYWFKDTVLVDSLINYYVVTQNGNYQVVVQDSNGCVGADSISMLNVGLQQHDQSNTILIYPNPTNGLLNLDIDLSANSEMSCFIADIVGNKIGDKSQITLKAGIQKVVLDLNQYRLNSGIYFLHIKLNGKSQVIKIEYHSNE